MKKASIIVRAQDAPETIMDLRSLGVLHIEHNQPPQSKDVSSLQEDANLINSCFDVFARLGASAQFAPEALKIVGDWKFTAKHIIDLWKRYDQLESYSRSLTNTISEWEKWGDFDPHELQLLNQKRFFIKLYQIPLKQPVEFPETAVVKNIFAAGGVNHYVVISKEKFECPFKELTLPKQSLSWMRHRLNEDKKLLDSIKKEIHHGAGCFQDFVAVKQKLEKEIEFQQALSGMGKEGELAYVSGYLPFDRVEALRREAKNKKWGILVGEPQEEDSVPTFLRNGRLVSLISPLFRLLEIIPGYRELDISFLFLIFFSIFFGIIIGDAGYGLVYLLLSVWLRKKLGGKVSDKRGFNLVCALSSCAIIWGLFTGTVFGQEWYLKAGFKPLIPKLNDTKFIQMFCLLLGAFHLTLAHSWKVLLKLPSLSALAEAGWVFILWAAFFLAKTLILGDIFPIFVKWFIIVGITLVVFFTNPQKNILKTIGEGLGNLALSLVNNFTDVVSYIRLYAVGLAGVAISNTVNSLSSSSGNVLAFVLIGLIGHAVNIVLGPMSVLVHGLRLNVLEFSGHAGVTWSGLAYKPLEK